MSTPIAILLLVVICTAMEMKYKLGSLLRLDPETVHFILCVPFIYVAFSNTTATLIVFYTPAFILIMFAIASATFPRLMSLIANEHKNEQLPKIAKALGYFLPNEQRESLLGDLEEEYHNIRTCSGKDQAQRWYYEQVIWSVGPLMLHAARSYLIWLGAIVRRWVA
jgi:hypothetical protein